MFRITTNEFIISGFHNVIDPFPAAQCSSDYDASEFQDTELSRRSNDARHGVKSVKEQIIVRNGEGKSWNYGQSSKPPISREDLVPLSSS
jgi:hypothetical protein